MAKNSITSDMLEMILMKVTDKFTEALSTMMSQFSTIISATVNSKLLAIDARLDSIETKLAKATDASAVTVATVNKAAALDCQSAVEIASRAMLEFEREKEDARARSCNVIITGLPPNPEINEVYWLNRSARITSLSNLELFVHGDWVKIVQAQPQNCASH